MSINSLRSFIQDECGQDIIEYTLLLAFTAMASAALFIGSGEHVRDIWAVTGSNLSTAASIAGKS